MARLSEIVEKVKAQDTISGAQAEEQIVLLSAIRDQLKLANIQLFNINKTLIDSIAAERRNGDRISLLFQEAEMERKKSETRNITPSGTDGNEKSGFGFGSLLSGIGGLGAGALKGAIGIASMGAAITAFFGGLLIGEKALDGLVKVLGEDTLNFDSMKRIATGFGNVVSSLDEKTLLATGGLILAAGAISIGTRKPIDTALTIGFMGLAITSLFGGFVLGESALKAFGDYDPEAFELNSIKKILGSFGDIYKSLDKDSLVATGILLGAAGLLTAYSRRNPITFAASIALMGMSISAFFAGFAIGEFALSKFDPSTLKLDSLKLVISSFGEIVNEDSIKSFALIGGILAVAKLLGKFDSKSNIAKDVLSIAAIPAAIGTFLGGISLVDKGLDWINADYESIKSAFKNFNDITSGISLPDAAIFTGLMASGVVFGRFASISQIKSGLIGIAAIPAAIGTFIGGFALVDKGLEFIDADYNSLKEAFKAFNDITSGISLPDAAILGSIMAAGAVFGTSFVSTAAVIKGVLGMAVIPAAIGAFFGGFALVDKGLEWLDSDFSALKIAVKAFTDIVDTIGIVGLTGFTSVVALAAATGPFLVKGAGLLSAAIATFITGLVVGDAAIGIQKYLGGSGGKDLGLLIGNIASGISEFGKIDGLNLLAVAGGIGALSASLLAFFGSEGITSLGEKASGIFDWVFGFKKFGYVDPSEASRKGIIEAIIEQIRPINNIESKKLDAFSDFIERLSFSLLRLSQINFNNTVSGYTNLMKTMSETPIPDIFKPINDSNVFKQEQKLREYARKIEKQQIDLDRRQSQVTIGHVGNINNTTMGGGPSMSPSNIGVSTTAPQSPWEKTETPVITSYGAAGW